MEPAEYQAWLSGGARRRIARVGRREAVQRPRVQHLPPPRRAGPRPGAAGPVRQDGHAAERRDGRRRRSLHPRIDPQSAAQDHGRLPADHADVPGAGHAKSSCCELIEYVKSLQSADRRSAAQAGASERDSRVRGQRHAAHCLPPRHYLNDGYGIKSWLLTRDHKRIALLYLAAVTFFFFVGGAFAVLIRLELATPAGDLVSRRDLQQAVHDARRDDGVLLPDPRHPVACSATSWCRS